MRPGEPAVSVGSNGKVKELLGWAPADLASAIDRDLLADPVLSRAG
jgi:hypothetical protein